MCYLFGVFLYNVVVSEVDKFSISCTNFCVTSSPVYKVLFCSIISILFSPYHYVIVNGEDTICQPGGNCDRVSFVITELVYLSKIYVPLVFN